AEGRVDVELTCVAARDRSRAEAFAAEHGVGAMLADYTAVVDADVDAIYVPLPISLHEPWTLAALAAGKHVLCEKALASNAAEARRMADAARAADRVLMEAFHYRYHPLFGRVIELVANGAIGELRRLEAVFCVPHVHPGDIRLDYATGGGALMDLGCYCVHWLRHVTGREPRVLGAEATLGPPAVDVTMTAELAFPGLAGIDASGHIRCSLAPDEPMQARLMIEGDAGTLAVTNPLAPQMGHELLLANADGELREQIDRTPTYTYQLEAFAAAVRGARTNLTDGEDAVRNMETIDAIYAAAGLPLRGT
ncbi:MAG: Gfo/Idh/MocA family oxidoreductase, partial [Pseudomonadales bacterium]|nr:Gfo/Idh/MocA family oxidoreductase [Pseudomonadales bacterium]